jgi:hypothetical protein
MAKLREALLKTAIVETIGNLAAVARRFGVSRQAVHKFIASRPALRVVWKDAREVMSDNAESVLYAAILKGEAWAVRYFLDNQARDRGYGRQEMRVLNAGADGGPAKIDITTGGRPVDRSSLTADDLTAAARLMGIAGFRLLADGGPESVDTQETGESTRPES